VSFTYSNRRRVGLSLLSPLSSLPSTIAYAYDSSARLLGTWLEKSDNSILNSHVYGYNQGNQRTQQVFTTANYVNYTYDPIGLSALEPKITRLKLERWFEELSEKAVRRGAFRSVADLERAIEDFMAAWNVNPTPLVWTATAESILEKLTRCRRRLKQVAPGSTKPKSRIMPKSNE
jgi:hypothetical protein